MIFPNENIKSVIFKNVTNIGSNSFYGAVSLTEVIIPESVVSIGKNAFAYCENLKKVQYNGFDNPCDENTFQEIGTSLVFVSSDYENESFYDLNPSNTKCGKICFWKYNETAQELVITGSGSMEDFSE